VVKYIEFTTFLLYCRKNQTNFYNSFFSCQTHKKCGQPQMAPA